MARYLVNASVDDFQRGEIVDVDPRFFADLIEAQYLSPVDEWGNRLTADGDMLVLFSTEVE